MTKIGLIKSLHARLPEEFRSARIIMNHDPCDHVGGVRISFVLNSGTTNTDQCHGWLELMKAETGICFTTQRVPTFVDDERKDAPFRFGDDDMEDPVSRSAINAGPRTKCSEPKEKGSLLWAGAPRTVGPL